MTLSRRLFRASQVTRDAEVVTGRRGTQRLAKRVIRRKVSRKVVGPLLNRLWR